MKILRLLGNARVELAATPKPDPTPGTAVLKVKATALCGSELPPFKAADAPSGGMFNPGHEVAGIVEAAPPDCDLQPGMRAGARVVLGCGTCAFCRQGYDQACAVREFYPNAHAEYFRIPAHGLLPIPEGVDWPAAPILTGDGLGLPARAARRLGDTAGQKVLVLGLGPVGLSAVLVQSFKGAEVAGADLVPYRLELSQKLGAARTVNVQTGDLKQEMQDWTDGRGVDVVILAVARQDSLLAAVDVLRQQGRLLQLAELHEATIDPSAAFIRKELTMTGAWYYGREDWQTMLALHEAGLPYKDLITHVFPFEQAQKAYDTFASGQSGKVVLTYEA